MLSIERASCPTDTDPVDLGQDETFSRSSIRIPMELTVISPLALNDIRNEIITVQARILRNGTGKTTLVTQEIVEQEIPVIDIEIPGTNDTILATHATAETQETIEIPQKTGQLAPRQSRDHQDR